MSLPDPIVGRDGNKSAASAGIEHLVALGIYLLVAVALFFSAPHEGEFWWSDAPRHAMNGAFLRDMAAAFPWRDPAQYAIQYYMQYPALTILFYPPLFYAVLALFYALFGVSHGTALSVELLYYVALAFGLYLLARRWLSPWLALGVGFAVMVAPGIAFWGRQVMLEVPALASATWGVVALRYYLDSERPILLYLGAFILLCAIYTKINTAFLVPVVTLMMFAECGKMLLRIRHSWIVAVLFVVGVIPVIILTLKFGAANIQSVTGVSDAVTSRDTMSGWLWYAEQFPEQVGWPILVLAIAFPFSVLLGNRLPNFNRSDVILLLGWLVVGYVFFSAIALKEVRHSVLILPPIILAAFLTISCSVPHRFAWPLALLLCVAVAYDTARYHPVPFVSGYREAAAWIERNAPEDAVIVFSGYRDGSFIFNVRTFEPHGNLYTVRADKLLLEVAVRREIGVKEKILSAAEIDALLDRIGARYVVAQVDFWTDLAVMSRLQSVLQSDHFEEVFRIPVVSNVPTKDKEIRIYRNRHWVKPGARTLNLDLPIIGEGLEGEIGEQHH
jgi:Dolichyl-phosphate-mannose-protein mannosyltransferase